MALNGGGGRLARVLYDLAVSERPQLANRTLCRVRGFTTVRAYARFAPAQGHSYTACSAGYYAIKLVAPLT